MAHKSAEDLHNMLNEARTRVEVGGMYYHYKHPDKLYTLVDVIIIEATDEVGVLYSAENDDLEGVIFMRPIEDFLSEVEFNGDMVKRFTLVS